VQVVHMYAAAGDVVREVVGFAEADARFHAAACEPNGEAAGVMIATVVVPPVDREVDLRAWSGRPGGGQPPEGALQGEQPEPRDRRQAADAMGRHGVQTRRRARSRVGLVGSVDRVVVRQPSRRRDPATPHCVVEEPTVSYWAGRRFNTQAGRRC
jgi:hypothetical protein